MVATLDQNMSILIFDDNEADRMALKRALEETDFDLSVTEACDANVALDLIDHTQQDCVFLGYNLPGKNGLELTKAIRNRGIKVPVIVLTGQGNEQTAVNLMKAGASDYLSKSKLSTETLAQLIRSAIRMHQAEALVESVNQHLRDKNRLLQAQNRELAQQRQYIYKQNLRLQEVSRLKSEFLATMSHELKTPLNAIIGFSQILMSRSKGALSVSQYDMLSRILANGRSLLELINDILAFSQLEAGRIGLEPAPFNVVELVSGTVEEMRSLASQKSLSLEIDINIREPTIVNDENRLKQVLINLISNALKFTDKGSIRVHLSEWPLASATGLGTEAGTETGTEAIAHSVAEASSNELPQRIRISVIDTGCGISLEAQQYIFDPFYQTDQKSTRRYPGTGLGLAISHSIVKMMQGDITLTSQVDQGSTFTVEIPKVVVAEPEPVQIDPLIYIASAKRS